MTYSRCRPQGAFDRIEYHVDLIPDFPRAEPENPITLALHPCIAIPITLHTIRQIMMPPVNLDDQHRLATDKVSCISSKLRLPTKRTATTAEVFQTHPKHNFFLAHLLAKTF